MNLNIIKTRAKVFILAVTIFASGLAIASEELEFKLNPNMLPKCTRIEASSTSSYAKTLRWNNCWGRYKLEVTKNDYMVLEGEWRNGKLNGYGSEIYDSGGRYVGEYKDGRQHGMGVLISGDGDKYVGQWKNGKMDGVGTYSFNAENPFKGDKYEGNFKNGLRQGNGKYWFSNGEFYDGNWKDNLRHGFGTQIYNEGRKYTGNWVNDKKEGKGLENFYGSIYSGEYKNDEWHGFGEYIFGDGKYVGEFKNGMMHGRGFEIYNDGTIINEGVWESAAFVKAEKVNFANYNYKYYLAAKREIKDEIEKGSNPNNLPICEKKLNPIDSNSSQETKWNKCWGKFTARNENLYENKYEGEWSNGQLSGYGHFKTKEGNEYVGNFKNSVRDGFGKYIDLNGSIYIGNYSNGSAQGLGLQIYDSGAKYLGHWKISQMHGKGIFFNPDGSIRMEGIWEKDVFIRKARVDLTELKKEFKNYRLPERFENTENDLQVTHTSPDSDGRFLIKIEAGVDTASLKINGEEQGGRADGKYSINKVARAGQETVFIIVATDINGNTDTKKITVNRPIVESQAKFKPLNPDQVKKQPERDAVAIVIGIADYKNLPRADFANDDASAFYDYAIRALGIKPENIKLLVDGNADDVAIYQAFKTWLPSRVRPTTDVYVYYSGHGLPAEDGQGLYLLPQRAHKDLIEKTAISQREINGFIQAAKPKSVTIFLDSCYSGLARTGETLLASARPVALKADKKLFPDEFTVITASQADQISSSSPDLKHGIFSYYLMRGMEGEADANRDGKITAGEMHGYLAEQVARQAGMMNRRQEPQLVGDSNRVLVGK